MKCHNRCWTVAATRIWGLMTRKLDDDQKIGAKWLADCKYALLADKPGVGKTCQAIVGFDIAMCETILVICPAAVTEHWKREIEEMCGKGHKIQVMKSGHSFHSNRVCIASYNTITDSVGRVRKGLVEDWRSVLIPWDLVIIDEVHYLKTPTSARSKAVWGFKGEKGIVDSAARVWPLSGTPSPNNPLELYPMIKKLFADQFRMADGRVICQTDFIKRYCRTKRNGFGFKIIGGKNLDDLKARLAPVMLRRERKKTKEPRIVNLYLDCKKELRFLQGQEDINMWMALEDALINAASDKHRKAILDGIDDSLQRKMRRHLGLAKVDAMVGWAIDQLESGVEKLVLFGYHTDVLKGLWEGLKKDYSLVFVDGSTTKRDDQAQRFKNDPKCRVFIGQITAAGTGLDGLQVAQDIVLVEYSWVPGENKQVIARLDRRGQEGFVLARYAIVSGTMDEQILRTVMQKEITITEIFG